MEKTKEEREAELERLLVAMKDACAALKAAGGEDVVVVAKWDTDRLYYEVDAKTPLIAAAITREAAQGIYMTAKRPPMPEGGYKIVGMEEMLAAMDEEDRAEAKQALLNLAKGPARGARLVQALDPGPTICPGCEEPLKRLPAPVYQMEGVPTEETYTCTGCGGSFMREATVDA
jgi:hypothetical protein